MGKAVRAGAQGIGFAIPINQAKNIVTQLKTQGEVTRGWLGVSIQDLTPEMADYYGIPGKTGVFVAEKIESDDTINLLKKYFESVELVHSFTVHRDDMENEPIRTYYLYVCKNFSGMQKKDYFDDKY